MSILKRIFTGFFSGLHLVIISIGFIGLYVIVAEIIPDITNARRAARTVKADYRVENEEYSAQSWSVPMFLETHKALGEMRWHSFDYWRPAAFSGAYVNVDDRGVRRSSPPAQRPRTVRISVFGGSAVWGFGARDEGTIPSLLAGALEHQLECAVEVTNFGQPGYVSGQDLAAFTAQLRGGAVPDIAVFFQGFNDVSSAFAARQPGLPQNEGNRVREFNLMNRNNRLASFGSMLPVLFWRSNEWVLRMLNKHHTVFPPLPEAERDRLADGTYAVLKNNARLARALAAEYGVVSLTALQPVIFNKETRSRYEQKALEQEGVLMDFWLAVQRRIAADWASQPASMDLTRVFGSSSAPVFLDGVHLTEHGNDVVAQAMAERLAKAAKAACGRK